MSYTQLKCIIVNYNNVHRVHSFKCNFIQVNTKSAFFKKFGKNVTTMTLASYPLKKYINIIFQNYYVACKILYNSMLYIPRYNYHKKFGKNGIAALSSELCIPKIHHCYFY